jgi:hypothetical protein
MADSADMGRGPGASTVPTWAIIVSLLWLVFISFVCLGVLSSLWPHPTPAGTPPPVTETTDTGKATIKTEGATKATPSPASGASSASGVTPPASATDTAVVPASTGATGATGTNGASGATGATGGLAQLCKDADYKEECDCYTRADLVRGIYYKSDKAVQSKDDPSCVYVWMPFPFSLTGVNGWHLLWSETRLLLIVMICGFLGALIYALRSLFYYIGHRSLLWSWLPMYLVVPIVGSMMAVVFYLVLRGGLFSSTTTVADTSPFGFAGIAALVGMFIQQSAEKLKDVFNTILTTPQRGGDAVDTPATTTTTTTTASTTTASTTTVAGPEVTAVTAKAGSTEITIDGDHFTAAAKVFNGATELTVTKQSEKQLTAAVAALKSGDTLSITVKDTAGTSKATDITVS